MTEKPPQRRNSRPDQATSKLNATQLAVMEWLFPGFAREYLATHDTMGKPLPGIQHLEWRYIGDQRNRT